MRPYPWSMSERQGASSGVRPTEVRFVTPRAVAGQEGSRVGSPAEAFVAAGVAGRVDVGRDDVGPERGSGALVGALGVTRGASKDCEILGGRSSGPVPPFETRVTALGIPW